MSGSPYADLDRPPLRPAALFAALTGGRAFWREIRVVAETASTNADGMAAARDGAPQGLVVVAEAQTAGRGRLGREWAAPPRAGLTFSALLRPPTPPSTWGWLPLLAGVALARAVQERAGLEARLKWPNDLLAPGGGKLGGILAEGDVAGGAVVLGIGLNVSTTAEELAGLPRATSLALESAPADRDSLLRAALRSLASQYEAWVAAGGAAIPAYRPLCATIEKRVRVELPGGVTVTGTATAVDDSGRLVVRADDGAVRAFSAGDVEHLR